jgi:phosphoribosylanthranilate isomerase
MTKIKLCGLSRPCDIEWANELLPEYIGFVFWEKSKRKVSLETASELKKNLSEKIKAVGVFVDEDAETVASLLNDDIIDIAQLHGNEDEEYIKKLRSLTDKEIIKAFKIKEPEDVTKAVSSSADHILLDAGMGEGKTFDHSLLKEIKRDYFLAGGLDHINITEAVNEYHPFAVDVSSGIETDGVKDREKMTAFVSAVRRKSI